MKKIPRIIFPVLVLVGILASAFYYELPDRHAAAVFLDKMNVFYIGVDNPISISACGVAPTDLRPAISGGTILRDNYDRPGRYIIRVNGGTEATLSVSMMRDSVYSSLGTFKFRVKRIPDPVAYVGNVKADGVMSKAELLSQAGVFARMENFDFDVKFNILSFTMSTISEGKWKISKANGPGLTAEMKADLQSVKPDDKVLFNEIIVKGPDGTLRKIPGVVITVK